MEEVDTNTRGGVSPTASATIAKARAHFGAAGFSDGDYKALLAFAAACPRKLVEMLQAIHFALVSPTVLRMPGVAFGRIAGLDRLCPYSKVVSRKTKNPMCVI